MGTEVASLYASLEADISPLDSKLAEADAALKTVADSATVATDVVAGLGAGAGVAAEGLTGLTESAGGAVAAQEALGAAGASVSAIEEQLAAESLAAAQAEYGLAVASEEAAVSSDSLAASNATVRSVMNDLLGPMIGVGIAVAGVKAGYDNTVGSTINLAGEVRKLGQEIGASAEDASKLIYAADITGVSFDTLSRSLNIAVKALQSHKSEGIAPTIDGLGQLSDKYLALAPGIERDAFLLHEFGRSGADLAPLMTLGSAGIKGLGDQALATGVVMSQQGVDAAYKYEQSTRAAGEAVKGLAIAAGEKAIPALTNLALAETQAITTQNVINKAVADGVITNSEAYNMQTKLSYGLVTQKQIFDQLVPAIQAHDDVINGVAIKTRDLVEANKDLAASSGDNSSAMTQADYMIMQYGEDSKQAAIADEALAVAMGKASAAAAEQSAKLELQAGMAGNITKAQAAYGATVEADAPKLAKLQTELAKYQAAQGTTIDIVQKGQYTTEQYADAQTRLAIALQRQAEYHGKSQASVMQLQLTVDNARDAVDKMAAHLGSASTGTADYTTKIGALKAQIDPLVDAENKAKDAIDKATGSLLYQAVSANLPVEAQTKIAHSLGLVSDADYNLAVAAEAARKAYDVEVASTGNVDLATTHLTNTLDGLKYSTVHASDVVPDLTQHVSDAQTKMADAKDAALGLGAAIDKLHDKTITVNVNNVWHDSHTDGHGGVAGGAAQGGEFVIPAGYNENYRVGPYVASSGETVTITPAGGRGGSGGKSGNTYNTYINDKLAAANWMETMRQHDLAMLERAMQ